MKTNVDHADRKSLLRRWERASLGKLLSKVSVAEMERAGSTKRLPLLASVNGGDASGARGLLIARFP